MHRKRSNNRQTERKKAKEWKKGDRVILSMKDLVFKKKASKETSRSIY